MVEFFISPKRSKDQKIAACGSSYGCPRSPVGAGEACDLLIFSASKPGMAH
jgi:hypothetical protein